VRSKKAATRVRRPTARNIASLALALRRGELVAVPTETVYGLAANALDARACRAIFRAKRRPANDPLIVHVLDIEAAKDIAQLNPAARRLSRRFWPGPRTLVLPKKTVVPDIVSAGLPSVAVRSPAHPVLRKLLRSAAIPLAAPSANPSGYVSPTTAEHVRSGLGGRILHILDGGPSHIGLESTIVDLRNPARPRLLRPGAISREALERVLGRRIAGAGKHQQDRALPAPGLLTRHYSPRTRVVLHGHPTEKDVARSRSSEAWLFFSKPKFRTTRANASRVHWLDASGDPRRAARRLFATLRDLDAGGFRVLNVELAPPGGIGDAINDRLRRAAARQ
jgi:L-threonylcarbamoyladenylate synthase